MKLFKKLFGNIKESTIESSNQSDIIACIDKHGLEKTFESLQAVNNETKNLIKVKGNLSNYEQRFEFDLFAFSYYLLYVKNINASKYPELLHKICDFYSSMAIEIDSLDPSGFGYLTIILKKNKVAYITDKIDAYQMEIKNIKLNRSYVSKYIFFSFYIYQLKEAKSLRVESEKMIENNIIDFQKEITITISMLESNATKLLEYVNL